MSIAMQNSVKKRRLLGVNESFERDVNPTRTPKSPFATVSKKALLYILLTFSSLAIIGTSTQLAAKSLLIKDLHYLKEMHHLSTTLSRYKSFELLHDWGEEVQNLGQSLFHDTFKQTPLHRAEAYAKQASRQIKQAASKQSLNQSLSRSANKDPVYQLIKKPHKTITTIQTTSPRLPTNIPELGHFPPPQTPRHSSKSFKAALGPLKTIEDMQNTVTIRTEDSSPIVFSGETAKCTRSTHMPLSRSCCSKTIKRHSFYSNSCSKQNYALASDRRAKRTHKIGRYCSRYLQYPFGKACIEETQVYCRFPSALSRTIQEKAKQSSRKQLNTASSIKISWQLKGKTAQWNRRTINHTPIAMWTEKQSEIPVWPVWLTLKTDIQIKNHQSRSVEGAVVTLDCQNPTECSGYFTVQGLSKPIHFDPTCQHNPQQAPLSWSINSTHLDQKCLQNSNQNPEALSYPFSITSWSLHVMNGKGFSWRLTDQLKLIGKPYPNQPFKINLIQKKSPTHSLPLDLTHLCQPPVNSSTIGPVTLTPICDSTGPQIAICPENETCYSLPITPTPYITEEHFNHWQLIELPQQVPDWLNITPNLLIKGQCLEGKCQFEFQSIKRSKNLSFTSWGTPKQPNCQGLTANMLAGIDWKNLDLSRYIHYQPINQTAAQLIKQKLTRQAKIIEHPLKSYRLKIPASHPSNAGWLPITAQPLQGQGPFQVTVKLAGQWPPNKPVLMIKLYWGDGTMSTLTSHKLKKEQSKPVYIIKHHYQAPNKHNQTYSILAFFYTEQAVHTAKIDILNIWNTASDQKERGGGSGLKEEHWVDYNNMPGFGKYD